MLWTCLERCLDSMEASPEITQPRICCQVLLPLTFFMTQPPPSPLQYHWGGGHKTEVVAPATLSPQLHIGLTISYLPVKPLSLLLPTTHRPKGKGQHENGPKITMQGK
jgi:hypothetical protein